MRIPSTPGPSAQPLPSPPRHWQEPAMGQGVDAPQWVHGEGRGSCDAEQEEDEEAGRGAGEQEREGWGGGGAEMLQDAAGAGAAGRAQVERRPFPLHVSLHSR